MIRIADQDNILLEEPLRMSYGRLVLGAKQLQCFGIGSFHVLSKWLAKHFASPSDFI